MAESIVLSQDELAFFKLTCDLFPIAESPLRFVEALDLAEDAAEQTFDALKARDLLDAQGAGAKEVLLRRLEAVAECRARLLVTSPEDTAKGQSRQNYYLHGGQAVAYGEGDDGYSFGAPLDEKNLVERLVGEIFPKATPKDGATLQKMTMSAGEYLVFAVFAQDARASQASEATDDSPMSVDEVLAFFEDEEDPSETWPGVPADDDWQKNIDSLCAKGVLEPRGDSPSLSADYHHLAREVVADHQHTVCRFDFLDDQWLVREVNLYPAGDRLYRIGTDPDGAVLIQELNEDHLHKTLKGIVCSLPPLLDSIT